jgi:hypothetical protein
MKNIKPKEVDDRYNLKLNYYFFLRFLGQDHYGIYTSS